MKKNKKMYLISRIVSLALVLAMLTESFLGSGNIVLAANKEETERIQGLESGSLEGTVTEDSSEDNSSNSQEYNTEDLDILFEVEENRDRTSKHYRLSDGTIMAADYGMDVHYEENGEWKDIDNRFVYETATKEDPMEGFSTAEGNVTFKFAPDTGDGEVVRATTGGYSVGFELLAEPLLAAEDADVSVMQADDTENMEETDISATVPITFIKGEVLNAPEAAHVLQTQENHPEPVSSYAANAADTVEAAKEESPYVAWADAGIEQDEADGDRKDSLMEQASLANAVTSVGYGNVRPGVSLQYIASGSSLKEYILLSEPQESYVYTFAVDTDGLKAELQEDGSILLYDPEEGTAVYEIPAAYMTDAAGAYSDAVAMELEETEDGGYLLTLRADAQWIDAKERVFPVQIDPTLNVVMDISDKIRGFYAIEGKDSCEEVTTNYGEMIVGFDSGGEEERITYIQLKNLSDIPKNSVICGARFYFYAYNYSQTGWPKIHVNLREVTSSTSWSGSYTWSTQPQAEGPVLDTRTVTTQTNEYVGWDITELIKKHYENGNLNGQITAFQLRAEGGEDMDYGRCANIWLQFRHTAAKPVFQVFYRDTKGIEDYYTYQVQEIGNAGTAYIGDYNGQLTLAKNLVSYESTAMPYSLGIVYNSSYDSEYFNHSQNIHTKVYGAQLGRGWKLTAQETVTELSVVDLGTAETYLVYNDSDGTEHYFKQKESGDSVYEDEDGLGLTITKSGQDYTMKDKKDNLKIFTKGYLTRMEDANGNKIHIVYNGKSCSDNAIHANGSDRITSVWSQPAGSTSAKEIFLLEYDASNDCLSWIKCKNDSGSVRNKVQLSYSASGGYWYLSSIGRYDGSAYHTMAQYQYLADTDQSGKKHCYSLAKVFDAEAGCGMEYTYYWTACGYRVYTFQVYEADSINGSGRSNGELVRCYSPYLGNARYRSAGSDGILEEPGANADADDVVTVYLFNDAGQTVNVQSEDQAGDLLGVTASAYTQKEGTSKKNHRMTGSVSSGQGGINLLANGGFESGDASAGTAGSWYRGGGNIACRDSSSGSNHTGNLHFNLYNNDKASLSELYQDIYLQSEQEYTFSAYVNTSGTYGIAQGGGAYLLVEIPGTYTVAKSPVLGYRTDTKVDGGWQRISVTFKAGYTGNHRCFLVWENASGLACVDDVQLEKGGAATRFSHAANGSFEDGSSGWTLSSGAVHKNGSNGAKHGSAYLELAGGPEKIVTATQQIPVKKSAGTTFLLSGWSKADSIAELASDAAEKPSDTGVRFWGITLTLNYSDGTKDYYNLPFSVHVKGWQYAAMAVTPKPDNLAKTIESATLRLEYRNNANTAWFDSISFIEEPSQTYTYDEDGNLQSVKNNENDQSYGYNGSTQNLMSVATEGSGTYTYKYDENKETLQNVHLPVSVTNDTVTMDIAYTPQGESSQTTLRTNRTDISSPKKMTSTSAYSDGLLRSATDQTGSTTSYDYYAERTLRSVTDAAGQSIYTNYDALTDRVKTTYQAGLLSVGYGYEDGNLVSIRRSGYLSEGASERKVQNYSFAYDDWGNRTGVYIGENKEIRLASYEYDYEDAYTPLKKTAYGGSTSPLASISYTYDKLGRVTDTAYLDVNSGESVTWGYQYGSDGVLSGIEKNGKTVYTYDYDTLGRLIHSSQLDDNGNMVLYTDHEYDSSDRIKSQGWQMGNEAFEESYTYNSADGTLGSMSVDGEKLTFGYDYLKRLDKKSLSHVSGSASEGIYDVKYTYRDTGAGSTTTQVHSMEYVRPGTTVQVIPKHTYSYDARGNIEKVEVAGRAAVEYTYDKQNQLIEESEGDLINTYTYDTYGNIRSITTEQYSVGLEKTYAFTYSDSGAWKDQLTKVTYTGYDGTIKSGNITYDAIGNPLTYFNGHRNWNFTWKYGRQLASATDGTNTVTNTYDIDGIRQSKTVNGVEHKYVTLDGKIIRETFGDVKVDYFYDNDGSPLKIRVSDNETSYTGYYVLNQQGDVIGIVDANGDVIARYYYNAWGLEVAESTGGRLAEHPVKQYNALKYRGYYYDAETGFYYVSSRYYDPEVGRFISADGEISGVGGDIRGYNLYSYCFNNPVNMSDPSGNWPQWLKNVGKAIVNFFSPKTNSVGGKFQDGAVKGSASVTAGYSEVMLRGQGNKKVTSGSQPSVTVGAFGKVSVVNTSAKIGVGNKNTTLSVKGVGDVLTASAQAGIKYQDGLGLTAKAKAAVFSGRATLELDVVGWQIEFGVTGDALSVGAEATIGIFDGAFETKANASLGVGGGFVLRVKPPQ